MSTGAPVSAARFFDEHLPQLVAASAFPERKGDIIFEVGGPNGGRWLIRLGDRVQVERVEPWVQGDLLLRMDPATFNEFLDATLDLERSIEDGRLLLAGDLTLLDELAAMWRIPKTMVQLRASKEDR